MNGDLIFYVIIVVIICISFLFGLLIIQAGKYAISNKGFNRLKDTKIEGLIMGPGYGSARLYHKTPGHTLTANNTKVTVAEDQIKGVILVKLEGCFDREDIIELM